MGYRRFRNNKLLTMEQIAILDYNTNNVYIYDITEELEGYNVENLLKELGHDLDNCSVMFGENIKVFKNDDSD
mgnify:FL=1